MSISPTVPSLRRVGFIVDHPKRDLPGGVMLAHALGALGIETALVPLYDQAVDVPLLGLDALIVNYARPVNLELVRGYRDAGLPVWVLDTEGGVLANDGANSPDQLASYIRESGYGQLLSGYFFWGSELHRSFECHSGMTANTLHLTGCPRFDFAAPRWRGLLQHLRSGYVLVNMNFPLVNPLFAKSPQAERETLVAAGWKMAYVDKLINDSEKILISYVELVRRLAVKLPQQQFLVRPHPFENANFYRESFSAFPNVTVDGEGSVLNVISNSTCVLHVNCGTAIESVMLEKLPISLEFLNTEHMAQHSTLPSEVSFQVNSEQQLLELLADLHAVSSCFDFEVRHTDLIRPWFYLNDGQAASRIASVLAAAIGTQPTRRKASVSRSLASSRRSASTLQRLQAIASNVLGSHIVGKLRATIRPQRIAKQLDLNGIGQLVQAIGKHDSSDFACRASRSRHPLTGTGLGTVLLTPDLPRAG